MRMLIAYQDVATNIGLEVPAAVSTSTLAEHVRLVSIANDAAKMIADAYDWQLINTSHKVTGDGTNIKFPVPHNFDKFKPNAQLWNTTTNLPLIRVRSPERWHEMDYRGGDSIYQRTILMNDQLHVKPALALLEEVVVYLQSSSLFADKDGVFKKNTTADDDQFRLNDRLLCLAMRLRWKDSLKMENAAEKAAYEAYLTSLVATDKGTKAAA